MSYQKEKIKKNSFKITSKNKIPRINLTKELKDLYTTNYKTVMKEIKDVRKECKPIPCP